MLVHDRLFPRDCRRGFVDWRACGQVGNLPPHQKLKKGGRCQDGKHAKPFSCRHNRPLRQNQNIQGNPWLVTEVSSRYYWLGIPDSTINFFETERTFGFIVSPCEERRKSLPVLPFEHRRRRMEKEEIIQLGLPKVG